jgi:hypothetical protein
MKRIFFLLFLLANAALAQKKKTYTVYVNYPDYTLKTDVLSEPLKKHAGKELEYAWYSSNRIMHTKGGYEGKVLDGPYTSFYLSNNLKEKGEYCYGVKQGEWITWYESGTISSITAWRKGQKQGICKSFDEKGELLSEAHYRRGKLSGFQYTYENNKEASRKKFRQGKEVIPKVKKHKDSPIAAQPENHKEESRFKKLFQKKGPEEKKENKKAQETKKEEVKPAIKTPKKKLFSFSGKKKTAENEKPSAAKSKKKKNGTA